jgi:small subunit ribosomal protein S4
VKLFLKGDRCMTSKCAVERRAYPPGDHGSLKGGRRHRKPSDYALQLREKQKIRRIYGVLERQFRLCFVEAERMPGMTGENLLQLLERRLDNVVYRLGLADSRAQARQLVLHGHFAVNGHKMDVPSYIVRTGDMVVVRERSQGLIYFKDATKGLGRKRQPGWLALDPKTLEGRVVALPARSDVDVTLQEQLVVEYYSR